MSKQKPRRKKNSPTRNQDSNPNQDSNRGQNSNRGQSNSADRLPVGGILLALIGIAGLGLLLYRSNLAAPKDTKPIAVPRRSSRPPEKLHAGPAAFTFTLENAALSPDGRVTAWSYGGNELVMCLGVWGGTEPDLSQQITLRGHSAPIRSLAFSGHGQSIASASADHTVRVWDVASGQESVVLEGHTDEVTAVAFAPDGVSMASGSRDRSIRLWDAYGGLPMVTLQGHTGAVTAIAYSADGKRLASASDDNSIKIWDMETGQQVNAFDLAESDSVVRAIVFSPSQWVLATSDGGDSVRLWDVDSGRELDRFELEGSKILSAAFSPDGTALAVAATDGRVVVKTLSSRQPLADFVAPETPLFLQYAGDGSLRWSRFSVEQLTQMGATGLVGRIATQQGTAEKAISGFVIPDGMQVELFANESLVANPAALCRDDQGRMYVAETFRFDTEVSLGYAGRDIWLLDDLASQTPADRLAMYEKHSDATDGGMRAHRKYSERIRRLEDRDGDGKADHATIFAEGFNEVLTGTGTGLITRDGALYYTCIPDLWKLTDTVGDGVADDRQVLHTGFGVKASLPHGLHGLAWGPDGKLYFSVGDRGYHIQTGDRTLASPSTGAVLRCNADGSELEEVARGFRNPQELAFDQFGNLFTCDNNSNQGDKSRLVYVVPGGDSGWEMSYETMPADFPLGPWNMDKMWQPPSSEQSQWVLPPVANVGTGPAGFAFYPGQGLPDRYAGHFFLCDFADAPEASGIRSFSVKANGAGFEIEDEHSFVSNILPTDIEFGLDQKIYISDWIRGATSDGLGRIYTASFPASIDPNTVAQTESVFAGGFDQLSDQRLVELIGHGDMRVRQRSQFELARRGADVIEVLAPLAAQHEQQLVRLHAIWALGMIGRDEPAAFSSIMPLLADTDDEVRAQAAKVLGEARYREAADGLTKLLQDPKRRVRAFAAHALGRIGKPAAIKPLMEMLRENDDQDVYLRHAGVFALFSIGDADAVAQYAEDDQRSVRLATLLTLRRFRDDRIVDFLNDDDRGLVLEAARAIHDLPIKSGLDDLAALLGSGVDDESFLRRAINANLQLGTPQHGQTLADFVATDEAPEAMKVEAIRTLGLWLDPPPRDRVLGFVDRVPTPDSSAVESVIGPWVAKVMDVPGGSLQKEIMLAAANLKIDVGTIDWISDANRSVDVRTQLLDMMAEREDPKLLEAIDEALATGVPMLRIHAARLLANVDPNRAVDALTQILAEGTTAEQQFAFATLGEIDSPKVDTIFVRWLSMMREGKVPPPLKYDVLSAANGRENGMVRRELSSLIGYLSQLPSLADRYQAVLEGGSIERGRSLFENHTGIQCIRCHVVNGKGGKVGPDLSKIGANFSREYLLESLLVPEAKIAKGFEGVIVSTVDGKVLSGTLQSEDERELRIMDANGESLVIAKSDIEQRQGGKSVMPSNLLQLINSSNVRDLVEYLASLK